MPARRKPKRPASRPAPTATSNVDLAEQVAGAEGWDEVVEVLKRYLGLEDLNTRHGLRSVHKSYPQVSKRLSATYDRYKDNEHIRVGLVMVGWKMCNDSVLRDKLVEDGYLAQVAPLLQEQNTRGIALKILGTVTHHGGTSARCEVIRSVYPTLRRTLRAALEDNGDSKTADQCVAILGHAASAVIEMEDNKEQGLDLDVPELLRLCTSALRIQTVPPGLFRHTLGFVGTTCVAKPKDILSPSQPSPLHLMIACLRLDDVQERLQAYYSLYVLYQNRTPVRFDTDPNHAMRVVQQGLPHDIGDAMMNYGMDRCSFYMTMRSTSEGSKAFMKCAQDRDLLDLGWTLFRRVLETEYSVVRGCFQDEHGRMITDLGLPFDWWDDSLPHCAKAIREAGPAVKKNLDAADCLELKYYMIKQNFPAASSLAQRAIERNPKQPFFHYIYAGATTSARESVQRAKFGLKMCNASTSTYVRCGLLHLSFDKSIILSREALDAYLSQKPGRVLEEAVAYLTSALEDSTTWLQLVPPDMRRLPGTFAENLLLQLVLKGKEISPDLKEVRPMLDQFHFARRTSDVLYGQSDETQAEFVCKLVTGEYAASCSEWGATLAKIEAALGAPPKVEPPTVDEITAWLDGVNLEDGHGHGHDEEHCGEGVRKKLAPQELYRCTYCGNPSAALKKCSRCHKAVYCGAQCQKTHWTEGHKKTCVEADA